MVRRSWVRVSLCLAIAVLTLAGASCKKKTSAVKSAGVVPLKEKCTEPEDRTSGLPLPSSLGKTEYQRLLFEFLDKRRYALSPASFAADAMIRESGPFTRGVYLGTHPAVRVWYSPAMKAWMGDRSKCIPQGAMIIKEMFEPPAELYIGLNPPDASWWTVMVRDENGAWDGWFWSYYDAGSNQQPDSHEFPFHYPENDFGQYCVRCHASSEKFLTFSNEAHLPSKEHPQGHPMPYVIDRSFRRIQQGNTAALASIKNDEKAEPAGLSLSGAQAAPVLEVNNNAFKKYHVSAAVPKVARQEVQAFPPLTHDRVVQPFGMPTQFVTSDQCMSCHDADAPPFGPNLMVPDTASHAKFKNVSPNGEWRWSLMGLAGRDPVFHAQLESEMERVQDAPPDAPFTPEKVQNTCFKCHGAMGQRQMQIDAAKGGGQAAFTRDILKLTSDSKDPHAKYASLARDGISCTVCHQMQDYSKLEVSKITDIATGNFDVISAEGKMNTIIGPRPNVVEHPMVEAIGMKPQHAEYIRKSEMCSSCHTVYLPVVNPDGTQAKRQDGSPKFVYEQATYLEWYNSSFRENQTCQSCHMPSSFNGSPITSKIANIEDQDYPDYAPQFADHIRGVFASVEKVTVKKRQKVARHSLNGINLVVLNMFGQYADILGLRKSSYMSMIDDGWESAMRTGVEMAQKQTASVSITNLKKNSGQVAFDVTVQSKVGHRFPSGVGFRRAFLEVTVREKGTGRILWASGLTDDAGAIINRSTGRWVASELRTMGKNDNQHEPHHQLINREDQVQIYEEIIGGKDGCYTTSFLDIFKHVKDNRLLPVGWTPNGPLDSNGKPRFNVEQIEATRPHLGTQDGNFLAGRDTTSYVASLPKNVSIRDVEVQARLFYQPTPPTYLRNRFNPVSADKTSKVGWEARSRLYYMASNMQGTLKTPGTDPNAPMAIEQWKIPIASALVE
jgi:hypothetical protein